MLNLDFALPPYCLTFLKMWRKLSWLHVIQNTVATRMLNRTLRRADITSQRFMWSP